MSFIGGMACAAIVALLIWFDRTQQRLGPCIILTEKEILLRDDRRIDFEKFESFGTFRQWEKWDQSETTYLTLKCLDGEELEILRSHCRGHVEKIKKTLEKWVEENREQ